MSDQKPREWKLLLEDGVPVGHRPADSVNFAQDWGGKTCHVIEKSAYDELQAKLAEAEAEIEKLNALVEKCRSANVEQVNWNIDKSQELRQEREISAMLREALGEIQKEIVRGAKRDRCLGCIDGSDMPSETLCRACWRIWVHDKMYLLWDWETTQNRISEALAREKEMRK